MNPKEEKLSKILNTSSDVLGCLASAAAGVMIGGGIGNMIGASVTPVISRIFKSVSKDFFNRKISKREERKIGAGYLYAIDRINKNLAAHKSLREDGFIDNENALSDSSIIIEGITLKLQKEWELKKLEFYGNFLGNISFEENIDFNYASVLLRITEDISYRQLCLIKVFYIKGTPQIDLAPIEHKYKNLEVEDNFNYSLYSDLVQMERLTVLKHVPPFSLGATFGNSQLSDIGIKLYQLMNLDEIDDNDYKNTLNGLQAMLPNRL